MQRSLREIWFYVFSNHSTEELIDFWKYSEDWRRTYHKWLYLFNILDIHEKYYNSVGKFGWLNTEHMNKHWTGWRCCSWSRIWSELQLNYEIVLLHNFFCYTYMHAILRATSDRLYRCILVLILYYVNQFFLHNMVRSCKQKFRSQGSYFWVIQHN